MKKNKIIMFAMFVIIITLMLSVVSADSYYLDTAVFNSDEIALGGDSVASYGLQCSDDGLECYFIDYSKRVFKFSMIIPYDISTGTTTTLGTFSGLTSPRLSLAVPEENFILIADAGTIKKVSKYALSPFTGVALQTYTVPYTETIQGMLFNENGTMFFTGSTDFNYKYSLSTPYDLSTITYLNKTASSISNEKILSFGDEGKSFVSSFYTSVYQYELSTPYDVSLDSKTLIKTLSDRADGLDWSSDGNIAVMTYSSNIFTYNVTPTPITDINKFQINVFENANLSDITAFETLWKQDYVGSFDEFGNIAIEDGIGYVSSKFDVRNLTAFNVTNGDMIWQLNTGSSDGTPLIDNKYDDVLWLNTYEDSTLLHKINKTTGDIICSFDVGGLGSIQSVAQSKDLIFDGSTNDFKMFAINKTDCTKVWEHISENDGTLISSYSGVSTVPTYWNDILFFGNTNDWFSAINATNGSLIWKLETPWFLWDMKPSVSDGYVYFSTSSTVNAIFARNATNGDFVWNATGASKTHLSIFEDYLSTNGLTKNRTTGETICSTSQGGEIYRGPAIINVDNIPYTIYADLDGNVWMSELETCKTIWKINIGAGVYSSPAIVDGVMYFKADDNYVYAIDLGTGAGEWKYEAHDDNGTGYCEDCVTFFDTITASCTEESSDRECSIVNNLDTEKIVTFNAKDITNSEDYTMNVYEGSSLLAEGVLTYDFNISPSEQKDLSIEIIYKEIKNWTDLSEMTDGYYTLMNDLDKQTSDYYDTASCDNPWISISDKKIHLDGAGHSIKGLCGKALLEDSYGFDIQNLYFLDFNITDNSAIVSNTMNNGDFDSLIQNSYFEGTLNCASCIALLSQGQPHKDYFTFNNVVSDINFISTSTTATALSFAGGYKSYINNSVSLSSYNGDFGSIGMAGYGAILENSYSNVDISNATYGSSSRNFITETVNVINSFYDEEGSIYTDGTPINLKNMDEYNDFDIGHKQDYNEEIWFIEEDSYTPKLGFEYNIIDTPDLIYPNNDLLVEAGLIDIKILYVNENDESANISFYDNENDTLIETVFNVMSGNIANVTWNLTSELGIKKWYVIIDSVNDHYRQPSSYNFEIVENNKYQILPFNNQLYVNLNTSFEFYFNDDDYSTVNLSFYERSEVPVLHELSNLTFTEMELDTDNGFIYGYYGTKLYKINSTSYNIEWNYTSPYEIGYMDLDVNMNPYISFASSIDEVTYHGINKTTGANFYNKTLVSYYDKFSVGNEMLYATTDDVRIYNMTDDTSCTISLSQYVDYFSVNVEDDYAYYIVPSAYPDKRPVFKILNNCTQVWKNQGGYYSNVVDAVSDSLENVYLASYHSSKGEELRKVNSTGSTQWTKTGYNELNDDSFKIKLLSDDYLIAKGPTKTYLLNTTDGSEILSFDSSTVSTTIYNSLYDFDNERFLIFTDNIAYPTYSVTLYTENNIVNNTLVNFTYFFNNENYVVNWYAEMVSGENTFLSDNYTFNTRNSISYQRFISPLYNSYTLNDEIHITYYNPYGINGDMSVFSLDETLLGSETNLSVGDQIVFNVSDSYSLTIGEDFEYYVFVTDDYTNFTTSVRTFTYDHTDCNSDLTSWELYDFGDGNGLVNVCTVYNTLTLDNSNYDIGNGTIIMSDNSILNGDGSTISKTELNTQIIRIDEDNVLIQDININGNLSVISTHVNVVYNHTFGNEYVEFYSLPQGTINISEVLNSSKGYISVLSDTYLDIPAKIKFVVNDSEYVPFRNGEICTTECSNIENDGSILTFNVSGWSNYTYAFPYFEPSITNLEIFPEILTPRSSIVGTCLIEDDNDGEDINYTYKWYKNNVLINTVFNVTLTEGTELFTSYGETPVEGDEWVFSCMGTDGMFDTVWQNSSIKIVIVNTAPATPNAFIQAPLEDTGSLIGICNGYDANNDTLSFNYVTYKNGIQFSSGIVSDAISDNNKTVVTITSENLVYDDNWTISCQANDGIDTSDFINSIETIVTKDPIVPSFTYTRLFPLILLQNETLSATAYATDVNLDNLNYTFKLYVNDSLVETKTNNSNVHSIETSIDFDYSTLGIGDEVILGVQVNDVDLTSEELNTTQIVVRETNAVPLITNIRLSPSTFIGEDDDVEGYCTATDLDGDTLNFNYQWYVNDIVVKSGSKIFSSYQGYAQGVEIQIDSISKTYYVEGDYIKFSCSAYDVKNESDYLNNTQKYIYGENNFIPLVDSINIIPTGDQNTLSDFTINITASDADTDSIQYEWRFIKNGAYQSVTTSIFTTQGVSYQLGELYHSTTKVGEEYYVKARVFDGFDYSAWSSSNTITISNSVPVMSASDIISSPLENVSLQSFCTASDVDSEQILTFSKRWYKEGVFVTTGDTLSSSYTQQDENWTLGCVANDGIENSEELNSSVVIIIETENLPIMQVPIVSGSSSTITGQCIANDADGDSLDYAFKLYENGIVYNSNITLDVIQNISQLKQYNPIIDSGDVFLFSCEATDNQQGSTGYKNSSILTVPTLTFSYNIEGTTETTGRVEWTSNADSVNVYLDDVLKSSTNLIGWSFEDLNPDTLYQVKLIPVKDDFSFAPRYINFTTEVTDNNDPVMQIVEISPSNVYTETAVVGICSATDVETSNLYYTYTWKVNNISVDTGVTSFYTRGTNVTVGALTSSNYQFNDTISLECTGYDSITNTGLHTTNVTVLNTKPIVNEELITIELSNDLYVCDYIYTDADGDSEINATYVWYINGINQSIINSPTSDALYVNSTVVGDEVICHIETGDAYNTIIENSSTFIVGDFVSPVISDLTLPESTYTDSSYLISAVCKDNVDVANGYPKVRFINPNYIEEEYSLYYQGEDTYTKYQTFNIAGEYTQIEIECKDGNSNKDILEYNESVLSLIRETIINIGGSGSTVSDDVTEFRNITSFAIDPIKSFVSITPGSSTRIEFEVLNKDIVDIDFTTAILVGEDSETYDWMTFSDGLKAYSFSIEHETGLTSNSKYIRFNIDVPEDVEIGTYIGLIEINGMEQTERYEVEIKIMEGDFSKFLSFLQDPLFNLPFSLNPIATPSGAVTGTVDDSSTPINALIILVGLSIAGVIIIVFRKVRG